MNFRILLLLIFCFVAVGCRQGILHQVCFNQECIDVELAMDPDQHQRGLQKRVSLGENKGMLFIFEVDGMKRFWMKDVVIPLDIIWINKDNRIVHIEHHVPPCLSDPCPVYAPPVDARYVLEVNGGVSDQLGLDIFTFARFHKRKIN